MTLQQTMTPWAPSPAPSPIATLARLLDGAPSLPGVDIAEGADAYQVTLAVPGVDPRSIELELAGDVLTVRGALGSPAGGAGRRWWPFSRQSEVSGRLYERLTLPGAADADRTRATYRDGILSIRLPKAGRDGRRIPVRAGRSSHRGTSGRVKRMRFGLPGPVRRLLKRRPRPAVT